MLAQDTRLPDSPCPSRVARSSENVGSWTREPDTDLILDLAWPDQVSREEQDEFFKNETRYSAENEGVESYAPPGTLPAWMMGYVICRSQSDPREGLGH